MTLWDPLHVWPRGRRWLWAALAVLVCLTQGSQFVRDLRPARDQWTDFFQEWASARNYYRGFPIYADQQLAVEQHLGYYGDGEYGNNREPGIHIAAGLIKVNAHPPTAVLLALPLASLDYPEAVLAWNLLSLGALFLSIWLVARALAIPMSAWSAAPVIALLLLCCPFREQVYQGQLSLVLLLLLTGTWIACRSNRPILAGFLLGLAVAVKLFPAFLFLFFLVRRQWRTIAAGMLSLIIVTAVTAAVLGVGTYKVYAHEVVPQVALFRSGWSNASLPGLWTKLFDPRNTRIEPVYRSMLLTQAGTWLSCGFLVIVLAWLTRRGGDRVQEDGSFALNVTAMLLVSPITWDHYFLLLLAPLAIVWTRLPATNVARVSFLSIVCLLWVNTGGLLCPISPEKVATSWQVLGILSLPCYALLGLFVLLIRLLQSSGNCRPLVEERHSQHRTPVLVSAFSVPCRMSTKNDNRSPQDSSLSRKGDSPMALDIGCAGDSSILRQDSHRLIRDVTNTAAMNSSANAKLNP